MSEPAGTREILDGLQRRLDQIEREIGISPTELAITNALGVLVSVIKHECDLRMLEALTQERIAGALERIAISMDFFVDQT